MKEAGLGSKKSMPLFLGVKVRDSETLIINGLKTAAKQILDHLKDNPDPEIGLLKEHLEESEWPFNSGWKRPPDFHVTCLFMNKN